MKQANIITALIFILLQSNAYGKGGDENNNRAHAPSQTHTSCRHEATPSHHDGPFFDDILRFRSELKLSKKQVEKIEEINRTYFKDINEVREEMKPLLAELHQLLETNEVDLDDVRDQLKKLSPSRIDIIILKIQHQLDSEAVLSDEQLELYRELKKNGRQGYRHRTK